MSEIVRQDGKKVNLRDYSRKDKVWDQHKAKSDMVARLYERFGDSPRDEKRAKRIRDCAGFLRFGLDSIGKLHLVEIHLCKNYKSCMVCQWRRSIMLKAKFNANIPDIIAEYPTARFISLTLTVKNPLLNDLRKTISEMNQAFKRMMKLDAFKDVIGYVRNVEVTKPKEDERYSHPHFHILLAVKSTYFHGSHYITENEYRKFWRDCLRVDYLPDIHVRAIPKDESLDKTVKELLKYSVKESDIDVKSPWFLKYVEQVHRLKFISTSGIFKNVVKDTDPQTDDELIKFSDEPGEEAQEILNFMWNRSVKRYQRTK